VDDQRPTDDLTEEQLAEVIRLVQALGDDYIQIGFTTREYCEALGVEPYTGGRAYRDALGALSKLKNAGLVKSGVPLKRRDVHERQIRVLGWRVVQKPDEHPPQSEEEGLVP